MATARVLRSTLPPALFLLLLSVSFLARGADAQVVGVGEEPDGKSEVRRTTAEPDSLPEPGRAKRLRWFPPRLYAGGVFYLPKVTYSDTRGLGFGGQLLFPFRWPGTSVRVPASDLQASARVTLKNQVEMEVVAHLHPSRDYMVNVKLAYETLIERYYGIGPDTPSEAEETYKPRDLNAYIELSRKVHGEIHLGLRAELDQVDLLEVEEGGELARGEVRGSLGNERAVGWGLIADWDRRDGRYFSTRGFWIQAYALFFDEELGSDFDFNNYHVDARVYLSPGEGQVIGLQAFTYAAKGEPPFWRYAELGGRAHSRGYRRGRYRDRVFTSAQVEYRRILFGTLGAAAFFGLADVASTFDRLELEYMKASFGGGPRILLGGPGRTVTVRFDVGLGGDVPRYYFSLQEAF